MITLQQRLSAFYKLGEAVLAVADKNTDSKDLSTSQQKLREEINDAFHYNGWFDKDNVLYMVKSIGSQLQKSNLDKWTEQYPDLNDSDAPLTIAVIMAGNVPLVGFHDFLSVLISGNRILAKLSGDDNRLLPAIANILFDIEPTMSDMVNFTDGKIEQFDAIIATGSDNTGRYFEYYFGKYPHIIRKNRSGIAVLTGNESDEDLNGICKDIHRYYGLGCRNISHLMVPSNYNFDKLNSLLSQNQKIALNHKYFNNYEYNKAIMLVNGTAHHDSGNTLITNNIAFSSPVSVVNYSEYTNAASVNRLLQTEANRIQCIVSVSSDIQNAVLPGKSQSPELWDYADNIDTMTFLLELKSR